MITFHALIPIALWLPLALAAVGLLVAYGVVNRGKLPGKRLALVLTMMGVTLSVPLVILLNPMWVQRQPPPPGKPLLTVLVDRSASMATEDNQSKGKTRLALANEIAQGLVDQLGDDYEIRLRSFAEDSSLLSLEELKKTTAEGSATDLNRSVRESLGEDRPPGQAVLVLSDGIETAGGSTARLRQTGERARALSTPVFVKTIGTDQDVRDLRLALHQSQELSFVGQEVSVIAQLSHTYPIPQTVKLTLKREGEEIESREIQLAGGETVEEFFQVSQEEPGLYRYEIAAETLHDEVTELNNQATLLLRVVDQPVSVLLLEGKPYWDTKFLIRTLASDPSVELTSVVQMAPGRFLERKIARSEAENENAPAEEGSEPSSAEQANNPLASQRQNWKIHTDAQQLLADPQFLAQFNVVVLGRSIEPYLTDEVLIGLRDWLANQEGSLVCFRGAPASQLTQRLGSLMPVGWTPGTSSRFRVSLTDSGQAMQWLPQTGDQLELLPSLASSAKPEDVRPLATVLATSSGKGDGAAIPLITFRPEGSGRVVVIEGAGMWRWAFLPPDHQEQDALYGTLWRSLVRWLVSNVGLMPGQRVALRPDSVVVSSGNAAAATLLLRDQQWDEVPQVELSGDTLDKPQTFVPQAQSSAGVYRVHFGHLPAGRYSVKVLGAGEEESSAETAFDVIGNLQERLDVAARPAALTELAEQSGGKSLDASSMQDLPVSLNDAFIENRDKNRPQLILRTPAWNRWWILATVVGLWGCTWGTRRWLGFL
ncbi:VWA domain-containing protein [Bremerella cremea]|uniref:VWA domain-containing protein n=1 Tax=Bremerella cremea TaxID=1031537 RepID=A0A368KUP0_9BACT|nr:vWA domain-containing protein [Bremerella cremea]RCS54089.1 VWA domain-containing protein [Bremerella cremea]